MAYVTIEKMKRDALPSNILRLRGRSMTLSENIAEKFQTNRTVGNAGYEKVKFGIAVDKDASRIKLFPTDVGGFSFRGFPSGGALTAVTPVAMKRLDLEVGDYALVDEQNLEFELAR